MYIHAHMYVCVCVCIHTYTHTQTHPNLYKYTSMSIHPHLYTHTTITRCQCQIPLHLHLLPTRHVSIPTNTTNTPRLENRDVSIRSHVPLTLRQIGYASNVPLMNGVSFSSNVLLRVPIEFVDCACCLCVCVCVCV